MAAINLIYEAFESRDFLAFFSHLSSHIQITQCPEVSWGGVFHGIEGAKLFFEKVNTYLEDHMAIERLIDGNDRIAVAEVTVPSGTRAAASMRQLCTSGNSKTD